MSFFCELNCELVHLRKCPNKEKRKKIQKILKDGRKARRGKAAAQAGAQASGNVESADASASANGSGSASASANGSASGNVAAEASVHGGGSVNANADHICWFCHVDVTNLENNKCAGCRKVTVLF